MNLATLHVVAVLLLLVVPGLVPARALAGPGPLAVVMAPLLTALICTAAATVSVVARLPLEACLALLLVPAWIASLVLIFRRPSVLPARSTLGWGQLAFFVSVLSFPLLAVQRSPVDWDARAIWLFHADWFWAGGAKAASALANPLFSVTHPDYPPLAPSTMASVWTVLGRDYDVGQLTVAFLVASAVLAVAVALCLAMGELPRTVTAAAGGAVILAAYGMAGATATNGYVDLLWAAALAAAAVCLLLGRVERNTAVLGTVCLALAMLTKNEGMLAGLGLVVVLVFVRGWRRALVLASGPVMLAGMWAVTARSLGAESEVAATSRFSDLLRLDPVVLDRAGPTFAGLWERCRWELLVAGFLAAVGSVVARGVRRQLLVTGWAPLWVTSFVCLGTVFVVYLVSPHDLDWYMVTSADRTTLAPRLLLLVDCVVWLLVLRVARVRPGDPAEQAGGCLEPGEPVANAGDSLVKA